jgi:hypothetical protein
VLTDDVFGADGELAVDSTGGNMRGGSVLAGEQLPADWSPAIMKIIASSLNKMPAKRRKIIWEDFAGINMISGEEVIRADNGFAFGLDGSLLKEM